MGTSVLHGDIEVNLGRVYKNMQETWSADSLIPGLTQTHSLHLPHLYTSVPLVNYKYGDPYIPFKGNQSLESVQKFAGNSV